MDPPLSPSAAAGASSKLRDVTRTVTTEAASHIASLKKSERAKAAVERSVAWGADALNDPSATAEKLKQAAGRLWAEDEKVRNLKEKGRDMLESFSQDEEKMRKVGGASPRIGSWGSRHSWTTTRGGYCMKNTKVFIWWHRRVCVVGGFLLSRVGVYPVRGRVRLIRERPPRSPSASRSGGRRNARRVFGRHFPSPCFDFSPP